MEKKDKNLAICNFVPDENTIYFHTDSVTEILRMENNGDIYIRGKLAENDKEVVDALRDFLKEVGHINKK